MRGSGKRYRILEIIQRMFQEFSTILMPFCKFENIFTKEVLNQIISLAVFKK